MADMPSSESRVDERVGSILKVRREDLVDEIRATRSQSQEGRGRKPGRSANANPSNSNRKRSLEPCAVIRETHIDDITKKRSEQALISINVR